MNSKLFLKFFYIFILIYLLVFLYNLSPYSSLQCTSHLSEVLDDSHKTADDSKNKFWTENEPEVGPEIKLQRLAKEKKIKNMEFDGKNFSNGTSILKGTDGDGRNPIWYYTYFEISQIYWGDLNNDGVEDAVVKMKYGSQSLDGFKNPESIKFDLEKVNYFEEPIIIAVIDTKGKFEAVARTLNIEAVQSSSADQGDSFWENNLNIGLFGWNSDLNVQGIRIKDNTIHMLSLISERYRDRWYVVKNDPSYFMKDIELALDPQSISGFSLNKIGELRPDRVGDGKPIIECAGIVRDGWGYVLVIKGKNFSLFENRIYLAPKAETMIHNKKIVSYQVDFVFSPDKETLKIPLSKDGIFRILFQNFQNGDYESYVPNRNIFPGEYDVTVEKIYYSNLLPVLNSNGTPYSDVSRARTVESDPYKINIKK